MVYSRAVATLSAIVTYRLLHEDVPARRPADAEEIASVVSFLVGPDASYVNGVTLPADGGASIYDPTSAAFADPA